MRYVVLLLMLAGCGMNDYRPQVEQPMGAKYEADLKECIQFSKDVRSKPDARSVLVGATGLVGYSALEITKGRDDPYFKNGYELTDECLKNKGYTLR